MSVIRTISSNFTVAQYCQEMARGEIKVNRNYQRSDQVWPDTAASFLIETVLLGYPVPKLTLTQITDLKTRHTRKEIVDGQQRSRTLLRFFQNELRITTKSTELELMGRTYNDLDSERQQAFCDYPLSVDVLAGATEEEIREVFRRINSYTVPLNPEENRHAVYQGEMKWFIYDLGKTWDPALEKFGVFTTKQMIRMLDAKLFAEVIHASLYGISTTDKRKLDKLYKDHDKEFAEGTDIRRRLDDAFEFLIPLESLFETPLMKPHEFYALLLAVIHQRHAVPSLEAIYPARGVTKISDALRGLSRLADALSAEQEGVFEEFVDAGKERTNVMDQRRTRFRWMCMALDGSLEGT